MALELIIVNSLHQVRVVNHVNGEPLIVAKGDRIGLTKKLDIKVYRRGSDLIIKKVNGEESVLKDFYKKSETPNEDQMLSWEDSQGKKTKIFSTEDSLPALEAAAEVSTVNNQIISSAEIETPETSVDAAKSNEGAALLLAGSDGEAPVSMLGGIATLGFFLLTGSRSGDGHSSDSAGNPNINPSGRLTKNR